MTPAATFRIYLLYILLALTLTIPAAFVQFSVILDIFHPTMLIIPALVAVVFGLILGYVHYLRIGQKESIRQLQVKDRQIRELNENLQQKSDAKTHQLSEQRLYTESILNAQNSIVIITDGYSIIKANRRFFDYIDDFVSLEDFKEQYRCICNLFVEKGDYLQPDIDDSRWTSYILDHPDKDHRALIRYNGKDYVFAVHGKKFIYGDTHKIIVTFEEITRLVAYEEDLQATIASELEKNRQKDGIIMQQSRFTAVGETLQLVSHHWRQPLSALSLKIQDIEEARQFGELDDTYLDRFKNESIKIINEMSTTLDSFRYIYAHDANPSGKFEAEKALKNALSIIQPNVRAEHIDLGLSVERENIVITGPQNAFIHAVVSILTNALEALQGLKQNRRISITLEEKDDGKVVVGIFNNGPAIAPDSLAKIFDPYYSTKFDKNGTGLGLFTSKNVIEQKMKGILQVKNLPEGVLFEIII